MKSSLFILFTLLTAISFSQSADGYKVDFHQYSVYGVFDIIDKSGDTSNIVGFVEFEGDTLHFTDLKDSMIVNFDGGSGVNTDVVIEGNEPLEPNVIISRFAYMGNPYDLMSLPKVEYVFNDSNTTTFTNETDAIDTLHKIKFVPSAYFLLSVRNEHMQSDNHNMRSSVGGRRRRQRSDFAKHWQLRFNVYCSRNPKKLDVESIAGNKVKLGLHEYIVVYH